jgi:predicted DNA-binding transcriptional regulator YafY
MLAAWCELRAGFRHFRADRIWACEVLDESFAAGQAALLQLWQDTEEWNYPALEAS